MNETLVNSQQMEIAEKKVFSRNVRMFVLFALPMVYLSIIAAVFVHEVIGHGMISALLGGKFVGFGILIDGMGWAALDPGNLSAFRQMLILLAGAFFTTLFSGLFFWLCIRLKKQYVLSMVFLFLAYAFLMDGVPYFFWDAIYLGGIGDVSRILQIYPVEWLRGLIIVVMGLFFLAGMYLFNYLLITRTVCWLKAKKLNQKMVIAAVIFVIQVLAWLSFDWKQLIPVINYGRLPSVIPIILSFAMLFFIVVYPKKEATEEIDDKPIHWKTAVLGTWCGCVFMALIIILWLQNGVMF